MFIGPLRIGRRGAGGKAGHNHVGEDGARLGEVEGDEGRIHGGLPQILASPQEFRVDRADLVEDVAQLAEVGDRLSDLQVDAIGHIVPSRPPAGLADR
jgi:hypothetical protein